nr:MAG TPA: hypothetical protein [Caudoviricetes sp.]
MKIHITAPFIFFLYYITYYYFLQTYNFNDLRFILINLRYLPDLRYF